MPVLVLVKHSLPVVDPAVPSREWRLSEEGQVRSRILAEKLGPYNLDMIFSSNEPKAIETARISAHRLNVPVEVIEGLQEHERRSVGFLEKECFERSIGRFYAQPAELVFGEETADTAYKRFSKSVDGLSERFPQANLALITHGTVLKPIREPHYSPRPIRDVETVGIPFLRCPVPTRF